jgi:hypothetical protein
LKWKKHLSLNDARKLSKIFCDDFGLPYCQVFYIDVLDGAYAQYIYLSPPHILMEEKTLNRIGILMHELTHHLEYYNYETEDVPLHGYPYQLAKARVLRWCKINISSKANWKNTLGSIITVDDMKKFRL